MPGIELFGDEERREILDVLETGVLFRYNHDAERKGHWKARTFEQEFAARHGVAYAHLCSSGSTAVAVAMAAAGVGAGHEVIVPPFTYIATIEGALLMGAIPVFAEIDDTLCLSPEGIRAALTPNTKAVVLVHMCGAMARLDEIMELCLEHDLLLIEDTAQALGGTYRGKPLGTFGKVGAFSLDYFKIITAGEGGVVITADRAAYDIAHQFSDHGHDHIGDNRGAEAHPILGFNFRTSELHAAVALGQLRKLDRILDLQRRNKAILVDELGAIPQVRFRHIPDEAGDSATFLSFFLPDEGAARSFMVLVKADGLPGVQYWYDNNYHYIKNWPHLKELKTPMPLPQTLYRQLLPDYSKLQLPESDNLISRLISVQIRVSWSEEDVRAYAQRLAGLIRQVFIGQNA
jgi:8-amino-3,8-dideoxy-alpha-D-manno-octulosonate transaminase